MNSILNPIISFSLHELSFILLFSLLWDKENRYKMHSLTSVKKKKLPEPHSQSAHDSSDTSWLFANFCLLLDSSSRIHHREFAANLTPIKNIKKTLLTH